MEVLDSGIFTEFLGLEGTSGDHLVQPVNNSAFLSNHLLTATSSGLGYAKRWHSTKQ